MPSADDTEEHALDPVRRNWHWLVIQFFMRNILTLFNRYRARGLDRIPETGGGLVVVNHQSFLDPLLVGLPLQRPVSYVARDTLFPVPFIGWVLRNTYVMPINRDAGGTEVVRKSVKRMQDGFLVGVFPEGTRSRDGVLGELKPGLIALARRGKVPIYPVGISGAYRAMPRGKLGMRFKEIRVVFGEPIPAEQVAELTRKGNEDEFLATIAAAIQSCLDEANEWHAAEA